MTSLAAAALPGTARAQNPAQPPAFAVCAACHPVSRDKANGMGPNLRGIAGRKAGAAAGFKYSTAMQKSGIVWTPAELDAFLLAPRKKVPHTSMVYFGMADAQKRAAIVRFLQSLK